MKKYSIFYLDDQSFALPQVIHAIPKNIEYSFEYAQRIQDFPKEKNFDVVLLDFYLDKDGKTALDVIDMFGESIIISFSTCSTKNTLMQTKGATFGVEKRKNILRNRKLEDIFEKIFSEI